jgi:(2S)-methylsuccinyl-CoA dehydrogenase
MTDTVARNTETLILPGLTACCARPPTRPSCSWPRPSPQVLAHHRADGKIDRKLADVHQHQVHGYGWYAAYAELMNQVAGWAERLQAKASSARSRPCWPSCCSPNIAPSWSAACR